ncbi:MAG TPA: hypothetical protein VN883_15755 [Myxococcales bacterium]|jgi:hypothetical protein|nr:hypothetical protein [Myxococcales bacterium]
MQPAIATAVVWAFVLLCAALWRSGTFRAAAPVLAGPYPGSAAPPTRLREDEADEDRDERTKAPRASRRLTAPLPLACAVAATALLRVGVLLALGR